MYGVDDSGSITFDTPEEEQAWVDSWHIDDIEDMCEEFADSLAEGG